MEKMMEITEEYFNQLLADSIWLGCLEDAGVDNWDGIDYAQELYDNLNEQEVGEND